jgi:predicted Rossmann fold nucleotide-binding protein DprA/Smf involved in DNA uptake
MGPTQTSAESVHPDTQAVLLLCGVFAQRGGPDVKPLSLGEYNAVVSWLARHGRRPASLVQAGGESLPLEEPGLPAAERLRALLCRGFQLATALERWQRLGLWVISRGEDCYPERLRRHLRSSAPPLLYGIGDLERLNDGGLAVVGSRNVDDEALAFTRRVGARCAAQDVRIVSGGARGVDRAAVASALEAGGCAVAVLAERLDRAATAREMREPLREGRLTLLTPYEPESGFTIGKAMGRNKLIYTLADFALVARFKAREGGTWSGAVEQLGRNRAVPPGIPVFVREMRNPQEGCEELRSKGALSFPEENFEKSEIVELLRRSIPPSRPVQPTETPTTSEKAAPISTVAESDTCFRRCLPLLLQHFQQEKGTKQLAEVAKMLQLLPKQMECWLQRAVAEGRLMKKKKKGRIVYGVASALDEPNLFDRKDDAAQ